MNFLTKLDRNRFTSSLDELSNDLSKGINYYPAKIIEAMQLAQTCRVDGKVIGYMTTSNRDNPETAYVTSSYKSGSNKYNNQNKIKSPDENGNSEGNVSGKVVFVGIEVVAANKTSLLDEYDVICDNQATIKCGS